MLRKTVIAFGLGLGLLPALAAAKKAEYLQQYGHPESKDGWVFTTGTKEAVTRAANALGVHYLYDPVHDRVDHPSAVVVLTPGGAVSTVMTEGLYPSARFAADVARAARAEIGPKEEISWFGCVHRDAVTGKTSLAVQGVTRLTAVGVILGLLTTMVVLSRRRSSAAV